jgi:hypothetical protein
MTSTSWHDASGPRRTTSQRRTRPRSISHSDHWADAHTIGELSRAITFGNAPCILIHVLDAQGNRIRKVRVEKITTAPVSNGK